MKINKHMNLVVPIETDDGVYYIHSTPILRETFERYFLVISKTFSAIYAEGLGVISGPRIALMMLKKIAIDMGVWDDTNGVGNGLVNEIRRLSNVIAPTETGWQTIPLQSAIDRKLLDDDDIAEAEGQIVFFICASAMHKKNQVSSILNGAAQLWDSQITLLSVTEYLNLLQTSTEIGNSGEMETTSLVPC